MFEKIAFGLVAMFGMLAVAVGMLAVALSGHVWGLVAMLAGFVVAMLAAGRMD